MSFICRTLTTLKRPKLLVQAARIGGVGYHRDRDLRRLIPGMPRNTDAEILESLTIQERCLHDARAAGATEYSLIRHVAVLSALIAELELTAPR